ncbi:hypothetical protein I5438_01705 [Citrobacter freundii]|uniref:hypothetical protein n=1 Tax=Citrobacter freundii TaxID=546 RepID=UPI0018FF5C22|nr:hypothetical protein [Citrobacter freundii]MBJ8975306.1 hypothetical protein [Citrobacter freundii]MBJ9012034.1 hypothetical protein [Citrobacter freundii]
MFNLKKLFAPIQIALIGFCKGKSHYVEYHSESYFTQLVFNITREPDHYWTHYFQDIFEHKSHKLGYCNFRFNHNELTISNVRIKLDELQDYIDALKEAFIKTNQFIENDKNDRKRRKKDLQDVTHNLKF